VLHPPYFKRLFNQAPLQRRGEKGSEGCVQKGIHAMAMGQAGAWLQRHRDTLTQAHCRAHETQVRIKRESVEGSGAAGVQPSKKQEVGGAINEGGLVGGGGGAMNEADLDWGDKGTVVVMALEEQLEVEFSPVWHTHMDEGGQREYRGAICFHKRRRVCSSRATKLTSVM
jgi:hypothetical protein